MKQELEEIIKHENENWTRIFKAELEKDRLNPQDFSSFWWKNYYEQITCYVDGVLLNYENPKLLEAGSGSGKASLLLKVDVQKTLFDISSAAIGYAEYLAKKFQAKNVTYVQGDIFSMPFNSNTFDFSWNIGVVEHYEPDDIEKIFREMIRVTKNDGIVAIGVPNFYSGPILKAWILKNKWLKFIPGYRLETENFYSKKVLNDLMAIAAQKEGKRIKLVCVCYFGNPLPMETPKWILISFGRIIELFMPRNKFLKMIFCKISSI